jgi:hypothetical protein
VTNVGANTGITSLALTFVVSHLIPGAYLFFCAVLTEYLLRLRRSDPAV